MTPSAGSPVLVADTGEAVDGRRLLAEAVGFGRALRAAGLQVDLAAAIDFARSMTLVGMGQKGQGRDAGAAGFVPGRGDPGGYRPGVGPVWRARGGAPAPA